jgi:Astacin (Peptidase family M12A)
VGDIIYERGRAIGLYYENNRPDRDDYVKINEFFKLATPYLNIFNAIV